MPKVSSMEPLSQAHRNRGTMPSNGQAWKAAARMTFEVDAPRGWSSWTEVYGPFLLAVVEMPELASGKAGDRGGGGEDFGRLESGLWFVGCLREWSSDDQTPPPGSKQPWGLGPDSGGPVPTLRPSPGVLRPTAAVTAC